ncbi:MAG: hypothetical protein COA88_09730 [Kordia sp.]|nr:MAG: hypothetical protein COA88_09730 [Kordia sp.]
MNREYVKLRIKKTLELNNYEKFKTLKVFYFQLQFQVRFQFQLIAKLRFLFSQENKYKIYNELLQFK